MFELFHHGYWHAFYALWAVIHQLSVNVHQFSAENAINSAQDFYRVQRPCSSIDRKYFGQLRTFKELSVELAFKPTTNQIICVSLTGINFT